MRNCRLLSEASLGWTAYVFFYPRLDPIKCLSSISSSRQVGGNDKSYNSEDCDFLVYILLNRLAAAPNVCKVLNLKYVFNSESQQGYDFLFML